jgi:NAD-dependent deacetylase
MDTFNKRLEDALQLIKDAKTVIAFTGAGISTESGISDFRSPGGVWDRYRIVTYQEFLSSREARIEYWRMKKELYKEIQTARPNRAHKALARLEEIGKLSCLVTQNIDGLHQDAGNSPDIIIELHGTNRKAICLGCGNSWRIEEIHIRLGKGDIDPQCEHCNGLIKPATVSFGQPMPEAEMLRAYQCARNCDLLLMIGSSLQVEPAASIPREAYNAGAKLIFINKTETPWDLMASVIFRESAGEVLGALVERLIAC